MIAARTEAHAARNVKTMNMKLNLDKIANLVELDESLNETKMKQLATERFQLIKVIGKGTYSAVYLCSKPKRP